MGNAYENDRWQQNAPAERSGRQPTLPLLGFIAYATLATAMVGTFVWFVVYGAFGG